MLRLFLTLLLFLLPLSSEVKVSAANTSYLQSFRLDGEEITKQEETTISAALPIATPEQVKTGLAEIKTAGKTIGKQIDIAQTTAALEKEFGAETAAAGKEMLERWAAGDAHALDGCIGGGRAWNLFVSNAYANPIAIAAGGCSVILAAAVITAVNSGNQQLLPDSIRNNSPFLDNLGYTVNEKGEIIPKDPSADTSFSCRFLGNCEMKIPSDGEETTRKPEGGSVAAAGGGGLEPGEDPGDWEPEENVKLPENDSQIKHIFRNSTGHLPDTESNRQLLLRTASRQANYVGKDVHGNLWYSSVQSDGSQVWVSVRNGVVQNGGVNLTPRTLPVIK